MINRLRTLLMNSDPANGPGFPFPGEELIDPGFLPRNLPPYLRSIHSILFGSSPDRLYLNYRMAQYDRVIAASGLRKEALGGSFDTTVGRSLSPFRDAFGFRSSGSALPISVSGTPTADDAAGRCLTKWTVTVETPTSAAVYRLTSPAGGWRVPFTAGSDNASSAIALDRLVSCVVTPVPGASWSVESSGRPSRNLSNVMTSLEAAGEAVGADLFGFSPDEPMRSYRNLWNDHPHWTWRLSGLLLAVAVRIEELQPGVET